MNMIKSYPFPSFATILKSVSQQGIYAFCSNIAQGNIRITERKTDAICRTKIRPNKCTHNKDKSSRTEKLIFKILDSSNLFFEFV